MLLSRNASGPTNAQSAASFSPSTRTGTAARLSAHRPEPLLEVNILDAKRYKRTDGGLARRDATVIELESNGDDGNIDDDARERLKHQAAFFARQGSNITCLYRN